MEGWPPAGRRRCPYSHRPCRRLFHRLSRSCTLRAFRTRLGRPATVRLFGLAPGYEDFNDHDTLRADSLLALAPTCPDATGQGRRRKRDRGFPLASSSTLNRLEPGTPEAAPDVRCKRIVAGAGLLEKLPLDLFAELQREVPEEIVLDVDVTDDLLHGKQKGRFCHGYCDGYCYLPLYVIRGRHILCGRLRVSGVDPAAGVTDEPERIVGRIRESWPEVRVIVRGDSGFCREDLMAWCEAREGVDCVFGLARDPRLQRAVRKQRERSRRRGLATGRKSRRCRDFRYRTRTSRSRSRRVAGKAEWLPGKAPNSNVRFVVTGPGKRRRGARELHEQLHCARGDMENRIKERQLDLLADRTSAATMRANRLRLHRAVLAAVRSLALRGTEMARAQFGTIRTQLLKVAAQVTGSVRRIRVSLSSLLPRQALFAQCMRRLRAAEAAARRVPVPCAGQAG